MNDKLETAVNLAWTAGNSNTRFGIAAKYQIDKDASFSVCCVCAVIKPFHWLCSDYATVCPFNVAQIKVPLEGHFLTHAVQMFCICPTGQSEQL